MPEAHWDAEKGIKDGFGQHYRDLAAFKAADDSRRLTLPQKPEDYQLALPKDFQAPQGIEFKPNENDPMLPQARAFAQKHGLSQEAFGELLALHAAGQISSQQTISAAKQAEIDKLGATGTARKTAIDTWLVATLGDDLGGEMSKFTFTAKQVQGIEKLMQIVRTQGAATPNNNPEPPPDNRKLSAEQLAKMPPGERFNYVRQFDQSKMPEWRDPRVAA